MLTLAIFFLFSLNSFYQLSIERNTLDSEWLEYKLQYNLNFSKSEEEFRKVIFSENYDFIMKSNAKNIAFTLKMNSFGHLDKNERSKLLMPYRGERLRKDPSPILVNHNIPLEYDWRWDEVVSPVKDQLKCGSCYAFSAVSAIESHFAIQTGVLPDLSEQEIIDCSWNYKNFGCYGGYYQSAFEYAMENGISTSVAYPYHGRNSICNRNNPNSSYKLSGYNDLTEGDEDNLLRALYHLGPISISVDANSDEYMFYESGIIDFPLCSSVRLNHAVLAVGYSLYRRPYLLVKNSWGKNWGIDGYFKVALFRNNMCGIASDGSFPILDIEN